MNRNDFTIAVLTDGTMMVAQGNPAFNELRSRADLSDIETGLYHSQLQHRCAYMHPVYGSRIGKPSMVPTDVYYVVFGGRPPRCVGRPVSVGTVR